MVEFDGVVDYNGSSWFGYVTATELKGRAVVAELEDRVDSLEVTEL